MVITRRARSDAARGERRGAILDAARLAFERQRFEDLTMAALARRAGLAKGTTYLYFATKEALFLTLLEHELYAWLELLERRLARLPRPAPPTAVAALLARTLARRSLLMRLLAILHTLLEHKLAADEALRFKQALLARTRRTGAALEQALGFLAKGEGLRLLLHVDALAIGMWQLGDPAPVVRNLLVRPELRPFRVRFGPELERALALLLRGWRHGSES